jgi:2-C-methyl-D-erythritol 4-phosphate cytidylyltransferase
MKNLHDTGASAVIVAGGMGKRLGTDTPKAFILLDNKPLFTYSLKIFDKHPSVSETVLVIPDEFMKKGNEIVQTLELTKPVTLTEGGEVRWQSVQNGISATDNSLQWVLVHDAARPFVTEKIIDTLLEKRSTFDCVITATPVVDTIRKFDKDACLGVVDRSSLLRVGTPQLFNKEILIKAFNDVKTMTPPPTDEAMLMEQCGVKIGYAWGEDTNFKITTKSDLELAEAFLHIK